MIHFVDADLKDFFRKVVRRRVNKDRSVIVDKRLYEAPVELIGKQVEILFHEDHPETVEVKHQRQSYGMLSLVDLHVNCRVGRDKNCQVKLLSESTEPCKSCKSGDIILISLLFAANTQMSSLVPKCSLKL